MLTFNPGPSQIDEGTVQKLQALAVSGYLCQSHRSQAFKDSCRNAVEGFVRAFDIPDTYKLVFQPSATAAMSCLLANCVRKSSTHFVHGAFSRRFFQTAQELGLDANCVESAENEAVPFETRLNDTELIAVTHNETSTGLMWPIDAIKFLRDHNPDPLIAVDVTSSLGCLALSWDSADIWFGSVQKALGLPAGLGFLVLGPRALQRIEKVNQSIPTWMNLRKIVQKMDAFQTVETPNMLAIALLEERMQRWDSSTIYKEAQFKAKMLYQNFSEMAFVKDSDWRSISVIHLAHEDANDWIRYCQRQGVILGSGYGPHKGKAIRVANFAAHKPDQIQFLIELLRTCGA